MTRKDYELIAAAIKRAHDTSHSAAGCDGTAIVEDLAEDLAGELEATNPRFDAARFLEACGVSTTD